MADIKKFTGYIAVDGSTHDTIKSAREHSRTVKIKAAVSALAKKLFDEASQSTDSLPAGFSDMDNAASIKPGVTGPDDLTELLLANREDILQAFNQEVRLRAPQKPRKPKAPAAPTEG